MHAATVHLRRQKHIPYQLPAAVQAAPPVPLTRLQAAAGAAALRVVAAQAAAGRRCSAMMNHFTNVTVPFIARACPLLSVKVAIHTNVPVSANTPLNWPSQPFAGSLLWKIKDPQRL